MLDIMSRATQLSSSPATTATTEDGEILNTENLGDPAGPPHPARLQRLIDGHCLREASSFGDQQADVLDEVGLRLVLRDPRVRIF